MKFENLETLYFSTEGRINRKIFIHYLLFLTIIFLAIIGLAATLGFVSILSVFIIGDNPDSLNALSQLEIFPILFLICTLLVFIALTMPFNFLAIRRLHDLNHSGWWIILPIIIPISYIPFILYLACIKGTPYSNKYGANPLHKEN